MISWRMDACFLFFYLLIYLIYIVSHWSFTLFFFYFLLAFFKSLSFSFLFSSFLAGFFSIILKLMFVCLGDPRRDQRVMIYFMFLVTGIISWHMLEYD